MVVDECPDSIVGVYENTNDLSTNQFAGWIINNILDTAQTIKNTSGTGIAETVNKAVSTLTIVAGTGTTAASVADYTLQTPVSGSSGSIAGTVSYTAPSSGTSGSFTVTGTITNSSGNTIAYSEVGMTISDGTNTFLIAHDVFSALNVSNGGTLAVTYTATYS
jgi:copper homeostasis protein CutC